jgi:antitoxin component of RelBE/YafQ-DinJ toxin-antitoxin module
MARKEVVQIRCSALEKDKWREIAASQSLELSAWIRMVLDRAAALATARTAMGNDNDR